ncbi:MAG TPA: hypothetical protein VMR33_09665 [Candidatus Baltobacteraceae bacterium]|jgi:hypothetical protein|nr:hypothetical protein [Candidatus Baltobacteraceae bacterium]
MNHRRHKKNSAQYDFHACKSDASLLQTGPETERALFQSSVDLDSPACSSVDDFSTHSPSGRNLVWIGSRPAALNRLWGSAPKPQDTGQYANAGSRERRCRERKEDDLLHKMNDLLDFSSLPRGFSRENPGAKNKNTPQKKLN